LTNDRYKKTVNFNTSSILVPNRENNIMNVQYSSLYHWNIFMYHGHLSCMDIKMWFLYRLILFLLLFVSPWPEFFVRIHQNWTSIKINCFFVSVISLFFFCIMVNCWNCMQRIKNPFIIKLKWKIVGKGTILKLNTSKWYSYLCHLCIVNANRCIMNKIRF
jgi:hypothetical protein